MKFPRLSADLPTMPGLLGGSRRLGQSRLTSRSSGRLLSILTVPLAQQGADEDQGMLVPTQELAMRGGTYRATGFRRLDCSMAS